MRKREKVKKKSEKYINEKKRKKKETYAKKRGSTILSSFVSISIEPTRILENNKKNIYTYNVKNIVPFF